MIDFLSLFISDMFINELKIVVLFFRHEYSQVRRDMEHNVDTADRPKHKLLVLL